MEAIQFYYKVTARNIFRYKKRFLMTVIGISGCSALLVAGFGIQDSIGEIAVKQYGDIFKFDVTMTYKGEDTLSQKAAKGLPCEVCHCYGGISRLLCG